jgi:hypothetical protein
MFGFIFLFIYIFDLFILILKHFKIFKFKLKNKILFKTCKMLKSNVKKKFWREKVLLP